MSDVEYTKGPRYINGVNIDAGIQASHPVVRHRQISDPVNDGSLGEPSYVSTATNKDGTSF